MEDRLSPADCRRLLGDLGDSLTDEEVLLLRDDTYDLSSVLVEAYLDFDRKAGDLELNETVPPDAALRVILGWDELDLEEDDDDMTGDMDQ